jgi:hypothetical protein
MGKEARETAKKQKLTIDFHVTREELVGLLLYLTIPVIGPGGQPHFRGTKSRAERKSLERGLDQLGILDVWELASDAGGVLTDEVREQIPEVQVKTLTFETIDTLLDKVLEDMSHQDGFRLRKLERRLEDAKEGTYELPAEYAELAPAHALEAVPAPVDQPG